MKQLSILLIICCLFKNNALNAMENQENRNSLGKIYLRYGVCLFTIGTLSTVKDILYQNNDPFDAALNATLLTYGVHAIHKGHQLSEETPSEDMILPK